MDFDGNPLTISIIVPSNVVDEMVSNDIDYVNYDYSPVVEFLSSFEFPFEYSIPDLDRLDFLIATGEVREARMIFQRNSSGTYVFDEGLWNYHQ